MLIIIKHSVYASLLCLAFFLAACTSTEVIESPKTAYVSETEPPKMPKILWTSRGLGRSYDYLGQVKARAWTYQGALDDLVEGAKQLRADAIIDINYRPIGFLSEMHAFAIKFKSKKNEP